MLWIWIVVVVRGIGGSPTNEAMTTVCKEDERLLDCWPCGPSKCSDLGTPIRCSGNTARCVQQCVCIDGYVWDEEYKCVPKRNCSSCGGDANAVTGCGNHCGNSCSDYRDKSKVCMSGCRYNSCDCREGYVFDDEAGRCVNPEDCTIKTCGKNEEWSENRTSCNIDSCQALPLSTSECENKTQIEPGCTCIEGYARNDEGDCVLLEQCPLTCKENEVYTNCTNGCEMSCATRLRTDGRVCPSTCEEGCVCADGHLRHDNGSCVRVEECSPPICDPDEEYLKCGPSCETTCLNINDTCLNCSFDCTEGCFCANGTVRSSANYLLCVPLDMCPPPNCGPNGYFHECPEPCSVSACSSLTTSNEIDCQENALDCCAPQCLCNEGFYKNDNGLCVSATNCTVNEIVT